MIFFGLTLNTSNLNGNIYLNCFISSLIDIVAYVANWHLNKWLSRPTFIACTMTFCGVLLVLIWLVPEGWSPLCSVMKQEDPLSLWNPTCLTWCYHWCWVCFFFSTDMHIMLQVLALGGRIGVTCAFCLNFVFYTELMPTVVRNMGLGVTTMAANIGTILCPYILYLGKYFFFLPVVCCLVS